MLMYFIVKALKDIQVTPAILPNPGRSPNWKMVARYRCDRAFWNSESVRARRARKMLHVEIDGNVRASKSVGV